MVRRIWAISVGRYEVELRMEDVDLENRRFREQRMPVHQQRTEADNASSARRTWEK